VGGAAVEAVGGAAGEAAGEAGAGAATDRPTPADSECTGLTRVPEYTASLPGTEILHCMTESFFVWPRIAGLLFASHLKT
jgi:hypothetical protein